MKTPLPTWESHVARWRDCQLCPLGQQRDRICIARGIVPCDVVFCGEAPGASEDATGRVFWGPAGDLLQQIIDRSLPPDVSYAMTNLVACFPREAKEEGTNEPTGDEIRSCRPRLAEFINLAQPRLIVCVGKLAVHYIDHGDTVPCCDIDHPAWILRMPLAQKGYAVQRVVVILRNAVLDMLQSPKTKWKEWGNCDKTEVDKSRSKQRYFPF